MVTKLRSLPVLHVTVGYARDINPQELIIAGSVTGVYIPQLHIVNIMMKLYRCVLRMGAFLHRIYAKK